jgi:hypothetical protein
MKHYMCAQRATTASACACRKIQFAHDGLAAGRTVGVLLVEVMYTGNCFSRLSELGRAWDAQMIPLFL